MSPSGPQPSCLPSHGRNCSKMCLCGRLCLPGSQKDALAVFWESPLLGKHIRRRCIYSNHILTQRLRKNKNGCCASTSERANNNRLVHLTPKQDNSYSKSLCVKRLQETETPSWRNLFNEALTDGPRLKGHPATDRTHSDNLYHSDIGRHGGMKTLTLHSMLTL